MRICYLDAFSGISGDMLVAALADAGADQAALADALASLGAGAEVRFEPARRGGIRATRFLVTETGPQPTRRGLHEILEIIGAAALPERVKQNATAVFRRLGEVEADIHQAPLGEVHFHEVGAADSICDIVGACLALELLGVAAVYSSPLNLGSGTVASEHGLLPVPAPATAALVRGFPVYARGPEVELTTPTGAALATTLACGLGPLPPMRVACVGYGAGGRDLPGQANLLRVIIGESAAAGEAVTVAVIEANIDDSSPEVLGYAMERLLEAGALDVTLAPLIMKKNRPGTRLSVIARPEDQETLARLVLEETSTLGVRVYAAERRLQARHTVEVETRYGKVRMKVSQDGHYAPEFEDCRRLALASGAPLRDVIAEANFAYRKSSR